MITEVIDVEAFPQADPPNTTPTQDTVIPATSAQASVTEADWQRRHNEVQATRAQRREPRDPWDTFDGEWVNNDIPETARPATPPPTQTTSPTEVIAAKARPKAAPAMPLARSLERLPQMSSFPT